MGVTREQKARNVRVGLGYVVMDQEDASVIYDVLTDALEYEDECFARGIGTDCDEFYDVACEHCRVEKAIEILKEGGLKNDRLTSIEKNKASVT